MTETATKVKVATVWLDGCSGCHMSFLDMDERIIALADLIELVWSPLVDHKAFPEKVDVTIVEGAVATDEDLHKIQKIRKATGLLISLGDCAVTGNVPSMRNPFKLKEVYDQAFLSPQNVDVNPHRPTQSLPQLLTQVRPVHEVVKVDVFVPGCPPPADAIHHVLSELLAGRIPDPSALTRFGK
jgi:NAD-reducing hydrogenase small subunit